jgi:GH15 family glucan-1,4-alpha-glucosidase
MARAITVGNGNLLVGLDYRGQVRDLYFPYVGLQNHVSGASGSYVHRIGVFVDDRTVWLDDPTWDIHIGADENCAIGNMVATNSELGLRLETFDGVHNEQNVFLRRFTLTDTTGKARTVKLFLAQQFRIAESRRGDTAFYDPRVNAIIHYKDKDTFLINATMGGVQFSEFNIGLFGIEGKEGTYHDANDGVLEKNPIEHGSVDSVLGFTCELSPNESAVVYYWIACGDSIPAVPPRIHQCLLGCLAP